MAFTLMVFTDTDFTIMDSMVATTSITASIMTPATATLDAIFLRMISPIGTGTAEAAVSAAGTPGHWHAASGFGDRGHWR